MAQDARSARSAARSNAGATTRDPGEEAGPTGRALEADAKETGQELKAEAREKGQELQAAAREKGQELKAAAQEKKDEVLERAEETAERQRHVVTDKVHAVAAALRTAGDDLDGRGEGQLASLGRQAADQIERLAGYLDGNDVRGLVDDLEGMARDNPGVFLGSTFASGLAAGRFLRSSAPDGERDARAPAEPGSPAVRTASTYSAFEAGSTTRTRTGGHATSAHAAGGADATRLDRDRTEGTSPMDRDRSREGRG